MLNATGLLESFYTLLWLKRDADEPREFDFFLPHTIVYEEHKPKTWFFSNKQGHILRKKSKNIVPQDMLDILLANSSKSGIAGTYMYTRRNNRDLHPARQRRTHD